MPTVRLKTTRPKFTNRHICFRMCLGEEAVGQTRLRLENIHRRCTGNGDLRGARVRPHADPGRCPSRGRMREQTHSLSLPRSEGPTHPRLLGRRQGSRKEMTMTPIYLDYNATTPVDPAVAEAVNHALRELWGNPSSSH